MPEMDEARGTLAGRYQLEEVIGRGGMGTVYRATDKVLGRPVAVKVLPAALAEQDPANVPRFEREARAAAALNHRAVVAIYDSGADEDARFIVMELVPGRSLDQIVREEAPLAPTRAAGIAARVADALAAAHKAGIVHRDIKPANVMVADDGSVKVLDFGIARAADHTALTQGASVVGTASYMAPEQALGRAADERSDIYALGCVLYAMLTGAPPFTGEGAAAILNQHAHVEPSSAAAANRAIPPGLDALVLQMLAKDPADRPQSAAAVRDLLNGTPARSRSADATAPMAIAATLPNAAQTAPTLALPGRRQPDHRRVAIAALVVTAIAVVAVIALASGGGSGSPRLAAPLTHTGVHRTRTHHRRKPTASTTNTTTSTTTTTPAVAPETVSGAVGTLTALIANDARAGTIDQPAAQQLGAGLADVLRSYEQGNAEDVTHKFAALAQQLGMLEQQGHVTQSAAPALTAAVANLGAAIQRTPAQGPATPPTPTGPPGQGGAPPGKAKPGKPGKHGHGGGGD